MRILHLVLCFVFGLRWFVGTRHVPESKTLPRIQKHFPESKTRPRVQKNFPESRSGMCFGFWDVFLDSGMCFWILGRVLDSGTCFGFWDVFCPYEPPYRIAVKAIFVVYFCPSSLVSRQISLPLTDLVSKQIYNCLFINLIVSSD